MENVDDYRYRGINYHLTTSPHFASYTISTSNSAYLDLTVIS